MIIMGLALFERKGDGFELIELMGDTTLEEVTEKTEADYTMAETLKGRVRQ
ncbi:hypothetical protein [Salinicoccus sediminis]|uniref:hypothetical protein n=1 Tax=Salinicoccus sediminis TaxID=1432562 RepID=UPI000A46ECA5|nr:hypothetical protein [Salinicoccus sediminis]